MIFPYGDDNIKNRGIAYVTYSIILINIIVFFFGEVPNFTSEVAVETLFNTYGAEPCKILVGQELWTIITSMFLHGSIGHILGNMLFLWIFGDNIEITIGHLRFLIFYLVGGIVASFAHAYFAGVGDCTAMVGASGAIAAVMGAYLVMFPNSKIKIFALIFTFRIPAYIFLMLWGIQELYSAITSSTLMHENEVGDGVAHMAHAGGFVYGIICGFYFQKFIPSMLEKPLLRR